MKNSLPCRPYVQAVRDIVDDNVFIVDVYCDTHDPEHTEAKISGLSFREENIFDDLLEKQILESIGVIPPLSGSVARALAAAGSKEAARFLNHVN